MRFVAFDTETTGFGKDARILEVAAVTFDGDEPRSVWRTMVNPGPIDWRAPAVQKALGVNGIRPEDVRDAPTFREVLPALLLVLREPVWVGHNPRFDLRMLAAERRRADQQAGICTDRQVPRPRVIADTVSLDYALFPNQDWSRKLEAMADRYCVPVTNAHTAADDSEVCGRIFAKMVPRLPKGLDELAGFVGDAERAYKTHRSTRRR